MANRPREDNVIYANFGAKERVNSAEETGGPHYLAPSYCPAAMRVYNAAVRQTDVGRVKRGTEYAAEGRVQGLEATRFGASARVVGSQNRPFNVAMFLPRRSREEMDTVISLLARTPGIVEKLKRGEYPEEALDVLLAASPEEIEFRCTCPDSFPVCKHAVALAERAASLIDADPVRLLRMRDISLVQLEDRKRFEAQSTARENAEPGSEYFWSGRELPALPTPRRAPMIEDSDLDLLHRAMQAVSFTNIDQLRAVADIEDLYDALGDI